jgi:F-type H+-transporting ATPase subunit delta
MATPATVTGVYAAALLAVARDQGVRPAVVEACRELAPTLAAGALAALDDPRLGKAKAKTAVAGVLAGVLAGRPKPLIDLLQMLIDRNRLPEAGGILADAVRQAEAEDGVVEVCVTSALPLSETNAQRITAATGANARLVTTVDPALVGGVTIRVGDRLVDASVRRHLREMHARMLTAPLSDALWDR